MKSPTPSPNPAVGRVTREAGDMLARLLLAAREDAKLRAQVLFLLKLPPAQRESLVNSALAEMALRGEPAEIRAAFAVLASAEGAERAEVELESPSRAKN